MEKLARIISQGRYFGGKTRHDDLVADMLELELLLTLQIAHQQNGVMDDIFSACLFICSGTLSPVTGRKSTRSGLT